MEKYRVSLRRTYLIEVEAENEEKALRAAEWFLTDPPSHYLINSDGVGQIEIQTMVENEAILEDL